MPIEILMPALSPTMTEGTLAKWHKKEGEPVASGDLLAEIETDKATMELEATDEGILGRIVVAQGTEAVPVNTPIAYILGEDEDAAALESVAEKAPAAKKDPAPDAARNSSPPEVKPESSAPSAAAVAPRNGEDRILASPLARRMAAQAGIDLAGLAGSGPNGRIVKTDIEAALSGTPAVRTPGAGPAARRAAPPPPGVPFTDEAASLMRKTVARRMTESKQTVPHFYLSVDCRIDELLRIRKEINAREDGRLKLSVNDFVIRAAALALMQVPDANASWTGDGIRKFHGADVAVAVALDDGLITPIIRGVEHKGLAAISAEMTDLAQRARDGKLMPEEYEGGGFTISNLGMYGIKEFAAIINPPQSCILAVGAGEPRAVVTDGEIGIATMMTCTLSVDHRAVDGALGARLLTAIKALIEYPPAMLL